MSKLMIASDLHGSGFYTEKLVAAYHREQPDRLLLLGDILYHGPRNDLPAEYDPKRVIALLNPLAEHILCVRGNCDSEVDQMVLDFPLMADYALVLAGSTRLFLTHGHNTAPTHRRPWLRGMCCCRGTPTCPPACTSPAAGGCSTPARCPSPKRAPPTAT